MFQHGDRRWRHHHAEAVRSEDTQDVNRPNVYDFNMFHMRGWGREGGRLEPRNRQVGTKEACRQRQLLVEAWSMKTGTNEMDE